MAKDTEPTPLRGRVAFEEWDFESVSPAHARDPEWNPRRLEARRRLLTLGKTFARRAAEGGVKLDVRTSLHHPHAFNGMSVRRLWVYLIRPKAEKAKLARVLGAELGRDLDSAYRNAYLCVALEHERLEVSLRIHPDAWYDGQHLVNRVRAEGVDGWLALLNALDGFQLRLHDWKGEWRCGALTRESVEEFLRYYTPGEHALVVDRRWPVPTGPGARAAVLGEDVPEVLAGELARLLPLYRFSVWAG